MKPSENGGKKGEQLIKCVERKWLGQDTVTIDLDLKFNSGNLTPAIKPPIFVQNSA